MSFRVKFDPVVVGQEIGRQCFAEGRKSEELEIYLHGAACGICIALTKDKPWMSPEFDSITNSLVKTGLQTYLDLLQARYLEIAPTDGEA